MKVRFYGWRRTVGKDPIANMGTSDTTSVDGLGTFEDGDLHDFSVPNKKHCRGSQRKMKQTQVRESSKMF
jgi:hypothetical protein